MSPTFRRDYDAASLVRTHPPLLYHPHKQLVYDLCRGAATSGPITVTRWQPGTLPTHLELAPTELVPMRGHFDYAGDSAGVWHLNFADPDLFFGYGTALLAQDELQCAEHPALGSIREAMIAEHEPALTEEHGRATPVLVAGIERRCTIETAPTATRPDGLYGNRFSAASAEVVCAAVRVHEPPPRSNVLAIAAPSGGRGAYSAAELRTILATAYSGFAAARAETGRLWPGVPTEIRTGFWGCGAFGGNRRVMTLMQQLAARLAGIARLRFYAFDDAGRADYVAGASAFEARSGELLDDALERIVALGFRWGHGDGN